MTGVSLAIAEEFGLPVYGDEAVVQALERPCFFVSVLGAAQVPLPSKRHRLEVSLDVTYFSERSGNYSEMYRTGQQLMELLENVRLTDGVLLRGRGLRVEVVDGLLHFFEAFTLHLIPAKGKEMAGGLMDRMDYLLDIE